MTREETKARFKAWCQRTIGNHATNEDIQMFENILALIELTRWIPVTEKLPDIDEDVLATDGLDMFVAWVVCEGSDKGWRSIDDIYTSDKPILAWMPLPQPYKAESEEK